MLGSSVHLPEKSGFASDALGSGAGVCAGAGVWVEAVSAGKLCARAGSEAMPSIAIIATTSAVYFMSEDTGAALATFQVTFVIHTLPLRAFCKSSRTTYTRPNTARARSACSSRKRRITL